MLRRARPPKTRRTSILEYAEEAPAEFTLGGAECQGCPSLRHGEDTPASAGTSILEYAEEA